ncbi:hypothetical protein [Gottfriedia luciferensis]|uniref:hypothetical protein n=1 Tax=Gottfriedia luciferensis TaxID=178774 RepID=UPI000B4504B7|nr:hypothetical protein [Gottfriedia luciferensis]
MRIILIFFILGKLLLVQSIVFNRHTMSGFLFCIFIIAILYLLPILTRLNKRELQIGYSTASILIGFVLIVCTVSERYAVFTLTSLIDQIEGVDYAFHSFFKMEDLLFIFDLLFLPFLLLFKGYGLKKKQRIKCLYNRELKDQLPKNSRNRMTYLSLKNINLNED